MPIQKQSDENRIAVIKIVLVADSPDVQSYLEKLLSFEGDVVVVGVASTGPKGADLAKTLAPHIVLIDMSLPSESISATTIIHETMHGSETKLIIVSDNKPDYLRQAILAGAQNMVSRGSAVTDLYTTIRETLDRPIIKHHRLGPYNAHIIVVYSPQAGAGVTTIATNLATALMRYQIKALLMDCNLQFGDVGLFLNASDQKEVAKASESTKSSARLSRFSQPAHDTPSTRSPRNVMTELIHNIDDLDASSINEMLTTHESGLKLLLAPDTIDADQKLDAHQVRYLLQNLSEVFNVVLVDTASHVGDLNLTLFDMAAQILVVVNPTPPSIRNVRGFLALLETLQVDSGKVKLVLNRYDAEFEKRKIAVKVDYIENYLNQKIMAAIPLNELTMLNAVSRGIAIGSRNRAESPAKELIDLADSIYRNLPSDTWKPIL